MFSVELVARAVGNPLWALMRIPMWISARNHLSLGLLMLLWWPTASLTMERTHTRAESSIKGSWIQCFHWKIRALWWSSLNQCGNRVHLKSYCIGLCKRIVPLAIWIGPNSRPPEVAIFHFCVTSPWKYSLKSFGNWWKYNVRHLLGFLNFLLHGFRLAVQSAILASKLVRSIP